MADWHPILSTVEPVPTVFLLVDQYQREYGRVRLVKRGEEIGYRAECGGQLVGYYRTLLSAITQAHTAYIRSRGPQGSANGGKRSWG